MDTRHVKLRQRGLPGGVLFELRHTILAERTLAGCGVTEDTPKSSFYDPMRTGGGPISHRIL